MPFDDYDVIGYTDPRPFLCRWSIHKWLFSHGTGHKYYECKRCGKRALRMMVGGYQPIDRAWLEKME